MVLMNLCIGCLDGTKHTQHVTISGEFMLALTNEYLRVHSFSDSD